MASAEIALVWFEGWGCCQDFGNQGMVWNGMKNGIEWNGNFDMEYERCQNGMEWKISKMK